MISLSYLSPKLRIRYLKSLFVVEASENFSQLQLDSFRVRHQKSLDIMSVFFNRQNKNQNSIRKDQKDYFSKATQLSSINLKNRTLKTRFFKFIFTSKLNNTKHTKPLQIKH